MSSLKGYGPFFIRLVLGPIFIMYGWEKVIGLYDYVVHGASWEFLSTVAGLRYVPTWPPLLWATAATFVEFFGGILVLVGMKVRPASALIGIVMVVAIAGHHLPAGESVEYPLALLAMSASLIASGSGRWSLAIRK